MESDATVRGQLVPHALMLTHGATPLAGAVMAPAMARPFKPMTEAEYRAQCVLQARVGLGLFTSAATGIDAGGPAPFVFEGQTQDEISALCSRLMELVQLAPLRPCAASGLRLPN